MTSILDSARAVRTRRSKVNDDDRAELTRLLSGRPLEVSRQRIPLAQRSITGPGESWGIVGLADIADEMRAAYRAVVEFLDWVDRINTQVVEGSGRADHLDAVASAGPKQSWTLLTVWQPIRSP